MKHSRLRLGTIGLFVIGIAACSSVAEPGSEDLGASASAITAAESITRAEEWVTAKLLYCQSPNGADDSIDPSCPAVCVRTSNPLWDPYRSDCSGLVSWAWGLPAPGRTTAEFAPNQADITSVISASSLQMGDAVNTDDSASNEHHIMLFKGWTVTGQTATFIEEPGCSSNPNYAHEFTSNVTLSGTSITVAYNGITFKAIRYGGLTSGGSSSSSGSSGTPPPSCTVNGVAGTCIDTSVCATMPGYVSTPGDCPGPATEQCCTPTGSTSASSSSSTTSSSGTSSGGHSSSGSTGTGGTGGAAGHVASTPGVQANSGCQASPAAPSPAGAAGLLAGVLLLRRRRATAAKPRPRA